jgi:enoyl-CoA hydratase/carnithine racemase
MQYQTLRLSIEDAVARITLARPESGNRIDGRLLRELDAACEAINDSESASLVVLQAEGRAFCTGWEDSTAAAVAADASRLDPFGCLVNLLCPVLASMQGAVVGAGLELALACDMRVAAEDARFSVPDVSAGRLPLAGGSARLPRIAGRTVASAMLLLGDELDAASAYRAGIVSRVFETGSLEAETGMLARRIAANGPTALRYAKEVILGGIDLPLDQALRRELDLSIILQTTRDRTEGVQAFLERRSPEFRGE